MRQAGVGDRMMRDGFVHDGINLAFRGGIHRINLTELSGGRSVMVYAQHEVLKDLIAKRLDDGGDVRFGVTDTSVDGIRRRSAHGPVHSRGAGTDPRV
jgi:p-hydroxybenzoate 3-monooxygenase